MAQLLVDVVFGILNFVSGIFLNPVYAGISALFPDLADFISGIFTYIGYGVQYISFFLKFAMVPTVPIILFISMWATIFTFNMTLRVVGLGMAIYHYFKP